MKNTYSNSEKYWVVIPAAGVGLRMKNALPKQYLPLKNKTIIEFTLAPFLELQTIEKVVVCLSDNDTYWEKLSISKHPKIIRAKGGQTRAESVLNSLKYLQALAKNQDWVIVHDAVRPCLRLEDLKEFVEEINDSAVGGLLAVPVRDTLKKLTPGHSLETLDRRNLWCAQTPQMFRYGLLLDALQKADLKTITDESQAMELSGYNPMITEGKNANIKITYPEDLILAEKIIGEQ